MPKRLSERLTVNPPDYWALTTEGNIPNEIGFVEFKSWLNFIKKQAKDQGFNQLQIIGQRAQHSTSANPGSKINRIFDLK